MWSELGSLLPGGAMRIAPWIFLSTCFLLGFCSLSYEFMLAQMMSLLEGHTVFYYCLTMGFYIFALGMGTLHSPRESTEGKTLRTLVQIEIGLAFLGGLAPFLMGLSQNIALMSSQGSLWALGSCLGLVLSIGWLTGRELPLLMQLAQEQGMKGPVLPLLGVDYIASFAGALAFPLWIFPRWGMVEAGLVLAGLNLIGALLVNRSVELKFWRWSTVACLVLVILAIYQAETLERYLSESLLHREAEQVKVSPSLQNIFHG